MGLRQSLIRSTCAVAMALCAAVLPMKSASANDYTDLWVTPVEGAWGVNFVQWGSIIFATFYIYGPDNKPVWYVAVLDFDGSAYHGTLYYNTGTYFGNPWKPSDNVETNAGTAHFYPSPDNNYEGTLTYTVITSPNSTQSVTKSITRLTTASIPLAGDYYGGQSGSYSGCTDSTGNGSFQDYFPLTVTQTATSLTLNFNYTLLGVACTLAGNLQQNGMLYSIPTASYTCADGFNTTAVVTDVKLTAQGIEGKYYAPNIGGKCREDGRFSAARK